MTDRSIDILADRVNRMACGKCGKVLDVSTLPPFAQIECPHCNTRQKVPAILGNFLLAEQMGAGGMGAVYRAVDQALGRFVAIKVMKQQLGADTELVESFLREARAAAALNHRNIVQIYSCGQEKGQPYIVMELVAGGRMDLLMEGGKKIEEARLLEIALDVAEGLKAADAVGLVHGDIKPANILFDQSGNAKVVDFGLAQFVNRQQEQGGVWGTPYYISPERARGGKADHRSDIYSLGATLFHALTGMPPFDGKTATDVVVARLKGPPPKLRELEPGLQPETAQVVERMMAADPVLRYPTSASLLADLRGALSAAKLAHSPAGRAKKPKKTEWGHLVVGGMALLIMAVLAFVVIRWFRSTPPPPKPGMPVAQAAVASTNEAATNAVAVTEAPEEQEGIALITGPDGKQRFDARFFNAADDAALAGILAGLRPDQPEDTGDALGDLLAKMPEKSARRMWLQVLQAPPAWLNGKPDRAEKSLREAAATPVDQPPGHVLFMPQNMALLLLGEMPQERYDLESETWPPWAGDLLSCLRGFAALKDGRLVEAAAAWETFVKSERKEPAWAFGLREPARKLMESARQWEADRVRLIAQADQGDLEGAGAGAAQAQADSPVFAAPAWETVRARVREIEAQRAEALRVEEENKRLEVARREMARVDAFMATNVQFTGTSKEYKKVFPILTRFQYELKTPEGQQHAQFMREQMERLEGLKTLLAKELPAQPFREPDRELGGEAIGANALGIRVTMPGRGTTTRNWELVSPRLMLRLVKYAIELSAQSGAESADLYLSLALYCVYNNGPEVAAGLLGQALARDPAAAEKAARLLPGITPPPPAEPAADAE